MSRDLLVWQDGPLGRIGLNRPKALNALTFEMTRGIGEALQGWRDEPSVTAILIEGAGERAFCAGGDILHLYNIGRDTPHAGIDFWRDEYRINAMIAHYPKPYIALMDGITMGGGVGVSAHGSHRIVTERSSIAMPEVSIGFLPDVGGTHILSRAPGQTGLYLGMTGARMNAADAIYAGFADACIASGQLDALIAGLKHGDTPDDVLKQFARTPQDGMLQPAQAVISRAFDQPTALDCVRQLQKMAGSGDDWAQKTLAALRRNAPLSVAAAFEAIHRAARLDTLEQCLELEFRFAARTLYSHDFYEGVRAAVVDKDRNPQWRPALLEDVTADMVSAVLAPLGDRQWTVS